MKKNKLISLIVAVLLISSTFAVFNFGGNTVAAKVLGQDTGSAYATEEATPDELKLDMSFVSGSAGRTAEEVKAEKKAENVEDDFIVTAIGNNLNSSATSETTEQDSEVIPETKPENPADEGIPYDIADPEGFESGEVEYADNQILIKFRKSFDGKVDKELKDAGIGKLEPMFTTETGDWYLAYLLKEADVNETMGAVRALEKVAVAEYNFVSEPASIDTDPLSDAVTSNEMAEQQWVLKSCDIQAAWDYLEENGINPGGSSSVTVAVIDTGVDYNHKDLMHNIWVNSDEIPDNNIDDDNNGYVDDYYGIDMTAKNGSGMDDHGHGTHVAGIIAAENNNIGVVGIAYNTKVMPVKAGDASGYFLQSNIAEAIMYAYNEGADVINMSFGGGASSVAVRDALETAYSRCVLVAAAGNEGKNERSPSYPAAFKFVLGVMSSDKNDVESSFTNWDLFKFNDSEYEVYAPGNEILSTLPGDRYAALSGTSMASPVVAAQAALLRSMFNDHDMYPIKFIYGQISGTAENTVTCFSSISHGLHNIPGRVNFEDSFKTMPRPEIFASDYTVFDTAGFDHDTEGIAAEAAAVNNGDGIIDSGEVIALGFTLRNRWGMSKDTVVSLSATNELGVTNPYVTILNNDINYGSVGTYSEKDAGKIILDDQWTGWENPFYLKIADNCPNDYTITLYISIECMNGLDENDASVYRSMPVITLVVRNGVILPNKITEDMTLTADNYYIIPNSTTIMEGTTVTVEPGTKIQFWTNDPQDAYADVAITFLKVDGQFLCKGTEEEPVELFPSNWMDRFRVQIYKTGNGFVSMDYTNITNPYITIDRATNCCFKKTYPNSDIGYRFLNDGHVYNSYGRAYIQIKDAKYCSFYKLSNYDIEWGKYSYCIFVDSAIRMDNNNILNNCVFYGNNTYAQNGSGSVSSINISQNEQDNAFTSEKVIYDDINDKYYVSLDDNTRERRIVVSNNNAPARLVTYDLFARQMSGTIASINTEEEYAFITCKLMDTYGSNYSTSDYWCGIHRSENATAQNYDDTAVPASIPVINGPLYYGALNQGAITFEDTSNTYYSKYLLEIPGNGLVTDIAFDDYVVELETGGTYQLNARIKPVTVGQADLIYTSEDETIATVDSNGIVTAIAPGTTQIKAYSQDLAIYNYITVNVKDYVALEGLGVADDEVQINIGDTKKIRSVFTPSNTTRTAVTYTSSDDSIASVSASGVVKANNEGDTVITLTGDGGLTATMTVHVVIPAESIAFSRDFYETNIDGSDDTIVTEPEILPADTTNKTLIWESTDPAVCTVTDGQLVKNATGIATLRATVQYTDLSDEITVMITDSDVHSVVVKNVKSDGSHVYAITEAGEVFVWGSGITSPTKMAYENVEDAYFYYPTAYILDKDGNVSKYSWSISDPVKDTSFGTLKNIKSLSSGNYMSDGYHAIDTSGSVWAWGQNNYGKLGDGSETPRVTPVQIDFDNEIIKVLDLEYTSLYLDAEHNVFVSGGSQTGHKTPVQKASDVLDIYSYGSKYSSTIDRMDESCSDNNGYGNLSNWTPKVQPTMKSLNSGSSHQIRWYFDEDGTPYVSGYNGHGRLGVGDTYGTGTFSLVNDFTPMIGMSDAKDVIAFDFDSTFVITNDGRLYGTGYNASGWLGIMNTENVSVLTPIEFFYADYSAEQLSMTSWNGSSGVVSSDGMIEVIFNLAAKTANDFSLITLKDEEGNSVSISKKIDLNKLTITAKAGMTDGSEYTLTIPQTALVTRLNGTMSEALTLTFTYHKTDPETGSGSETGTEGDDTNDTGIDEEETHSIVIDEEAYTQRDTITSESLATAWEEFCGLNINANFYSNVILNRLNDDNTSGWLRISTYGSDNYITINLGCNYWGTTNEELINKQILDYDDYQSLMDIDESNYLTEAPSDTFPFVTKAYLMVNDEQVNTVGNEEVTFVVDFNRAMDTTIPLDVKFGSSYPYADYTIPGEYVTDTEWHGTVTLNTLIENGYQYFSISNGKAAGTSLQLYEDWGRFPFLIDTSSAQSLLMQGTATEEGIYLTWTQDDFETLAGYNVYRSTVEDGLYTRVNKTVIPADTMELFDDTVEPGVRYYYNFTVVQSDMTESEPSGKVQVTSLDTMAPNIYHTPVTTAYKGSNLVISATIIDNVGVQNATLYYRMAGTEEWKSSTMDKNNDKYSAVVNSSYLTDDGLEYYIEAFDGIAYTYKGTAEEPFFVMVQEAFSASDLGDVDGNGTIELKDAMMLLMAVNDRLNLTEDEFRRADLDGNGELTAMEALKIICYINGTISGLI